MTVAGSWSMPRSATHDDAAMRSLISLARRHLDQQWRAAGLWLVKHRGTMWVTETADDFAHDRMTLSGEYRAC